MAEYVKTARRDDGVYEVRLDRPAVRNAFHRDMIEDITEAFSQASRDGSVRVVVLRGEGPVFCAGGDIHWMSQVGASDASVRLECAKAVGGLFAAIASCEKPTLTIVQGAAIGGGVGLVAASDIVIASSGAFFSTSETRLGIVPACVAPFLLQRLSVGQVRRLILTGGQVSAEAALDLGLIHEVADTPQELEQAGEDMVQQLLEQSPAAQRTAKSFLATLSSFEEGRLDVAMKHSAEVMADCWASEDGREGMLAFIEKRRPRWCVER